MRKTQIFNSTIELDKFYKDKISKSSNDISNILTINGVQIYEINVMGFETTNFHNEDITNYTKILLTNADQIKEHINNIELFATIIITTNDKKGIMYKTLRNQFVEDVEQIALFIAIINQNKQNKRSNNTIELYNDWKKPIKQNIILRSWNWIKITF
ncbi:hypothetical protein AGMMS50239_26530 [Bacteroidia bacterium]|nr:hypothetical protein FACS1894207_2840 [Bacteroidia bacterium]GHT65905.1 hypothetical protein AGMMS50239_26530 [Bacteroidia bacterium]